MQRQVIRNGRVVYVDLGPVDASKPRHGQGPIRSTIGAARLGHLPSQTPVATRKANNKGRTL